MRRNTGAMFALPALLVMAALVLYPIVHTLLLSVTDARGTFVGLANFRIMISAPVTATAALNTFWYVGFSIAGQVVAGTAVGILLNRRFRGRAVVRSLTVLPWVVPGIVAATTWFWMLHTEFGIVNHLLVDAGLVERPIGWLTSRDAVMPALVVVNVWKLFPFVAVMVLAGLQAVPEELYEAARVDGATLYDEIRYVMLPHLRPVLAAVGLLLTIWGLNGVTLIYTITRGGPANRTLITPIQILRHAFEAFEFNEAAALSVLFFAVSLVFVAGYVRLTGRAEGGGLS